MIDHQTSERANTIDCMGPLPCFSSGPPQRNSLTLPVDFQCDKKTNTLKDRRQMFGWTEDADLNSEVQLDALQSELCHLQDISVCLSVSLRLTAIKKTI